MYGCRYCKMDKDKNERCALTGKLTNGAMECDCEYEQCPEYKAAQEPIKSKSQAKGKLMQTSIFGAAGETPFRG